jgi:uncharacterized protein (DUF3084 family)
MLEILATKAVLFEEYVRRSELKETTPDAVDISDMRATRETVSQVEAERRIVEMERKRLRLESEDPWQRLISGFECKPSLPGSSALPLLAG